MEGGEVLSRVAQRLAVADPDACDLDALTALMVEVRRGQAVLAGIEAGLARRAEAAQAAGVGVADEVVKAGGRVSGREARRARDRAEATERLPELGADLVEGRTGVENTDRIAAVRARLTDGEAERFDALGGEISERARALPPEMFARYLVKVRRQVTDPDPDGLTEAEIKRARSEVSFRRTSDGMLRLDGLYDPERGRQLEALLATEARAVLDRHDAAGDTGVRGIANARAEALHNLLTIIPMTPSEIATKKTGRPRRRSAVEAEAGAEGPPVAQGLPSQALPIGYVVDVETLAHGPHDASLAQSWGGDDIDPATAERLCCDADTWAVVIDRLGAPVKVGRTRRAATRAQRLQLRALYDACPLDGTSFAYCHIHHVNKPWEDGGGTDLDNLVPVSTEWHHRIHDGGWALAMAPDRSLTLRRPDGTLERAIPPPTPVTRRGP